VLVALLVVAALGAASAVIVVEVLVFLLTR